MDETYDFFLYFLYFHDLSIYFIVRVKETDIGFLITSLCSSSSLTLGLNILAYLEPLLT